MSGKESRRVTISGWEFDSSLLESVGYDHIIDPITLKTHRHQGFELTFIVSGDVCWEVSTIPCETLMLSGGSMAVIQPGAPHKGRWGIISPSTLFWLILKPFDETGAGVEMENVFNAFSKAGNSSVETPPEIAFLLDMTLSEMRKLKAGGSSPLTPLSLKALTTEIVLKSAEAFSGPKRQRRRERLSKKAVRYMNANSFRFVSVPDIASHLGLSPARFSEAFKKETGVPPAQYLRRMRCDKARRLLETTDDTITKICFSLGFSSTQHFASVFKKQTGMTPKQYRAKQKKTWCPQC